MNYKILNTNGEHVADTLCAEEAAMLMACLGPGAKVTTRRNRVLWSEGEEDEQAGDSYDACANLIRERESRQ